MMTDVLAWLEAHGDVLEVLGLASAVLLVVVVAISPKLVARIPVDYFTRTETEKAAKPPDRSLAGITLKIARNLVGLALVVVGIAMLAFVIAVVSPGMALQGVADFQRDL